MTITPTRLVLGLVLFVAAGLSVQTWRLTSRTRELDALKLAPARAATLTAAARVETLTVQLAAAERVVTRVLTKVRTDTLMLAPQSPQDTARAVAQLPTLAIAHDSLQRACGAFVSSCSAFRTAAETRFRADSTYRVQLEAALKRAHPSRLGAVVSKLKFPLAFGAGLYLGLRVTR